MLATDFFALIGIDLVICALFLRAISLFTPACNVLKKPVWVVWILVALQIGLWRPWGEAGLPLLALARGVLSDFSVTSVFLSLLWMGEILGVTTAVRRTEQQVTFVVLAAGAALLYPTALGVGDWDAYRLGWGSPGLLVGLSVLALSSLWSGWRQLPLLISAALMAWNLGLLESGNLWDYLIDPWLACVAIHASLRSGLGLLRQPTA